MENPRRGAHRRLDPQAEPAHPEVVDPQAASNAPDAEPQKAEDPLASFIEPNLEPEPEAAEREDAAQVIAAALQRIEDEKRNANQRISIVWDQLSAKEKRQWWLRYAIAAEKDGQSCDWAGRKFDGLVVPPDYRGWIYGWPR